MGGQTTGPQLCLGGGRFCHAPFTAKTKYEMEDLGLDQLTCGNAGQHRSGWGVGPGGPQICLGGSGCCHAPVTAKIKYEMEVLGIDQLTCGNAGQHRSGWGAGPGGPQL